MKYNGMTMYTSCMNKYKLEWDHARKMYLLIRDGIKRGWMPEKDLDKIVAQSKDVSIKAE